MLQQARPGGRLAEAAASGAHRGPFLAPVELQVTRSTLIRCRLCSTNLLQLAIQTV